MAKSHETFILSLIEQSQGQAHPPTPYPLHDNLVVSEPVPLVMRSWGAYVYPFPNTESILIDPSGNRTKLAHREMIYGFEEGIYSVIYVDTREFTQSILPITTTSQDGWRVTMNINVTWKVFDSVKISWVKDPVQRLVDQCRYAVTQYIQSNPISLLVPMPGGHPIHELNVVSHIESSLASDLSLAAYEIICLAIRDRTGDPRITETIHDAILRQTETVQAQAVEIGRLQGELAIAAEKTKLATANGEVMVETARAEVKQQKEKLRIKVEQAQVDVEAMELLRNVKEELANFERARAINQLDQEQFTRFLEIVGKAFSDLSRITTNPPISPGYQPNVDFNEIFDGLLSAFDAIMKAYPESPRSSDESAH